MRLDTESASIDCPYCGERIEVVVDLSVDAQEYIEDCFVCCRPITLSVFVQDGHAVVYPQGENE